MRFAGSRHPVDCAAAWVASGHLAARRRRPAALRLAALAGACLLSAGCAEVPARQVSAGPPMRLADRQLDQITAAASSGLALQLSAFAAGATANTDVEGSIRSAPARFPLIAVNAAAPEGARARLVGTVSGNVLFANGRAAASGDNAASCAATVTPVGTPTFVARSSSTVTSPRSAVCTCTAFAITTPVH